MAPPVPVPAGGPGAPPVIKRIPITLATWPLGTSELREAETAQKVRIWRLLNMQGYVREKLDEQKEPGPNEFFLNNLDLDLSLRSAKPIPIDLGKASGNKVTGTVTLASNALSNLRLFGNLPGTIAQDKYGVASAKVESTQINLTGAEISTGGSGSTT